MRNKSLNLFLIFILIPVLFFLVSCKKEEQPAQKSDSATAPSERIYRIGIVYFGPDPSADFTMSSFFEGMKQEGFEEGKNLQVEKIHAAGDLASIPMLLQNYDNQGFDVIIPMSTPCLQSACSVVKKTPVAFMYVYDPIAAGAGKTFTDHLPNVTGVGSFPPIEDTIEVIKQLVPDVKTIGTIYNSSEANSQKVIQVASSLLQQEGLKFEEATITNTSEVLQAAQAVAGKDIQVFWGIGDNTLLQALEGLIKVTTEGRIPLVINDLEFVERGALAGVGISWRETGLAASKKVAQVLRGVNPKDIPFENVAVKKVVLNHQQAQKIGFTFPESILKLEQK